MKIFNFLKKSSVSRTTTPLPDRSSRFNNTSFMYEYDITPSMALRYYKNCSPIFNAVDLIASAISEIDPKIWDNKEKEFVENEEVLALLARPNADISWEEFIYSISSFYIITGNCYIASSGEKGQKVAELYAYNPSEIYIHQALDGFAYSYAVNNTWLSETFYRDESNDGFRFINKANNAELWQIKRFSSDTGSKSLYGLSMLNPIYYEIEQHNSSNKHNYSSLERGVTTSGILTIDPPVDEQTFVRLQEQMRNQYEGASKAGKFLMLNGLGKFDKTSMSNKDMDFLELKKEVMHAMYRVLKIPLALVSTDTMTLDNMTRAMLMFYDLAVLPLAKRLFAELTNFILPKYMDVTRYQISFDEGSIIALEPRRNEQVKVLKDLGIFTPNEMRAMLGYPAIKGGGYVYGQMSEVPKLEDETDDVGAELVDGGFNDDVNGKAGESQTDSQQVTGDKLRNVLTSKTDETGERLFSDKEIEELVAKYGLQTD